MIISGCVANYKIGLGESFVLRRGVLLGLSEGLTRMPVAPGD